MGWNGWGTQPRRAERSRAASSGSPSPASSGRAQRWRLRSKGDRQSGAVAVGAIIAVLAVTVAGLAGPGTSRAGLNLLRGAAWLLNRANGTVSHVNGYSGKPDAQVAAGAPNQSFTVVQRADGAYLVDEKTGAVSRLDGAALTLGQPSVSFQGQVAVATGGGHTWEVERSGGVALEVDPLTLAPRGAQVPLGGALDGDPIVDADGVLWARTARSAVATKVAPGGTITTVDVGGPGDAVGLTTARGHAVAFNGTRGEVRVLTTGAITRVAAKVTTARAVVSGDELSDAVLAVGDAQVSLVRLGGTGQAAQPVRTVPVAATAGVSKALLTGERGYLLDAKAERVRMVEFGAQRERLLDFHPAGDLVAKDGLAFVNDPQGVHAAVVDDTGAVVPVDKYTEESTREARQPKRPVDRDLPDPPQRDLPAKPDVPQRTDGPAKGPKGQAEGEKPKHLTAPVLTGQVGDASVSLSWTQVDAAESYVVSGAGREVPVRGSRTQTVVDGLPNDQEACFVVAAQGSGGTQGPDSNKVCLTPSEDVPGAVAGADVVGDVGDGEVTLRWGAAPDGRSPVAGYTITASPAVTGSPWTLGMETSAKLSGLENGTTYTFTIAARNGAGAFGKAATVADVTPFTTPGPVRGLKATSSSGALKVTWQEPEFDGGRSVESYQLSVDGAKVEVGGGTRSHTFDGLDNGKSYTVSVRAVNARGQGPAAQDDGTPAGKPVISGVSASADGQSVIVSFSVDDQGSAATCEVSLNGNGQGEAPCSGSETLKFDNLSWSTTYSVDVVARNDVGDDSASDSAKTDDEPVKALTAQIDPNNGAKTWVFKSDKSGTKLGQVSQGTTVEVTCKVYGWKYAGSGNWYLITGGSGYPGGLILVDDLVSTISGVPDC